MPQIPRNGSTLRQMAYARRVWGAKGENRSGIALDLGYSRTVAASPKDKIEKTKGFNNAMNMLAQESNSLARSIMHEFKSRGVKDFSNKDLIGALNAIGGAWAKFNPKEEYESKKSKDNNRLRSVILQQVENQTINQAPRIIENVAELVPKKYKNVQYQDPEDNPIDGIDTDF